MNWKITLTLFIVVAITGLLIFSDKGKGLKEKYLDKYISMAGSFVKGLTGKLKGTKIYPNNTFEATMTINSDVLKGQKFDVDNAGFDGTIEYNMVTIGGQNINVKNGKIEF